MDNQDGLGKNYILAFALSLLILVGYPFFLKWIHPQSETVQTEIIETRHTAEVTSLSVESAALDESETELHLKAPSNIAEAKLTPYENEIYEAEFSSRGGTIVKLYYKGDAHLKNPLPSLLYQVDENQSGLMGIRFLREDADLSQANFTLKEKTNQSVTYIYEKAEEYRLEKRYVFDSNSPAIYLDFKIENLTSRERYYSSEILYGLNYTLEKAEDARFIEAVVNAEKMKKASHGRIKKKGYQDVEKAEWAAALKKYFILIVKPDWESIENNFSETTENQIDGAMKMEPLSVAANSAITNNIFIYAGPQRYETLESYGSGLEKVAARGMLGIFKVYLLKTLKFFYKYTHNYGWAIIILTLLLKGAFTPLTHMSFENMKKMQVIQPKLKAIQERHKNDPNKLNQEMMQLYRRNKVNPMMGCLPMVLQIPVFIAFYQALSEAIELKGAPFMFWITDLSEPDRLMSLPWTLPIIGDGLNILPLFMIGSMVLQQKYTPTVSANPEQAKMMAWMPVIFGVMFYAMPSGLVLYWFLNNILSVIHQVFVKRIVVVLHHEDQD